MITSVPNLLTLSRILVIPALIGAVALSLLGMALHAFTKKV